MERKGIAILQEQTVELQERRESWRNERNHRKGGKFQGRIKNRGV